MPADVARTVRPTRRALEQLCLPLPDLGVRLSDLDHPLVAKAQALPDEVAACAGERIQSLTDLRWFKVKTGPWRGAARKVAAEVGASVLPALEDSGQWWWLGAAGCRQDDSPQHDFYEVLRQDAHRSGPNSCSTTHLLPTDWDARRLVAEAAVLAKTLIQKAVRVAARESLRNSSAMTFQVGDSEVRVRIRVHRDGQAYLALGATNITDAGFFAVLFTSFAGVATGDWLPEPGSVVDIAPEPGEIVWSTILTPEAQQQILLTEDT
jgi:hypothetical protein